MTDFKYKGIEEGRIKMQSKDWTAYLSPQMTIQWFDNDSHLSDPEPVHPVELSVLNKTAYYSNEIIELAIEDGPILRVVDGEWKEVRQPYECESFLKRIFCREST